MRVRVHYPGGRGRLVLRADADWEKDIRFIRSTSGEAHEFEIGGDRPFVYFKPVLVAGNESRWSVGGNYLALGSESGVLNVYPNFDPDESCSACELRSLDEYRYRLFLPPVTTRTLSDRYPVLYMQDGQNLFFAEEAYQGEHWRIGEALDVLQSMNAIERVIVVGIYAANRMDDYTSPGYEIYGRFLVERLKPAIDAEFRTLREPERTLVMGSSLGGVVSFYLAWQWPEVFGTVACLSSTFGYRDDLRERVGSEPKRSSNLLGQRVASGQLRDDTRHALTLDHSWVPRRRRLALFRVSTRQPQRECLGNASSPSLPTLLSTLAGRKLAIRCRPAQVCVEGSKGDKLVIDSGRLLMKRYRKAMMHFQKKPEKTLAQSDENGSELARSTVTPSSNSTPFRTKVPQTRLVLLLLLACLAASTTEAAERESFLEQR